MHGQGKVSQREIVLVFSRTNPLSELITSLLFLRMVFFGRLIILRCKNNLFIAATAAAAAAVLPGANAEIFTHSWDTVSDVMGQSWPAVSRITLSPFRHVRSSCQFCPR